jgi:IS5 family transposase
MERQFPEQPFCRYEATIEGAYIEANWVYADRRSASNTNWQFLKKHKIKRAIMHRTYKNKPLSARQNSEWGAPAT